MEIEVIAKGRNMHYDAVGIYDGKRLTVLKGSKISATVASKMNPVAMELRERKDTVDNDFVLKRDVTFRSSSAAATFVTGNIANGKRGWKLKDGKPLGSIQEK